MAAGLDAGCPNTKLSGSVCADHSCSASVSCLKLPDPSTTTPKQGAGRVAATPRLSSKPLSCLGPRARLQPRAHPGGSIPMGWWSSSGHLWSWGVQTWGPGWFLAVTLILLLPWASTAMRQWQIGRTGRKPPKSKPDACRIFSQGRRRKLCSF